MIAEPIRMAPARPSCVLPGISRLSMYLLSLLNRIIAAETITPMMKNSSGCRVAVSTIFVAKTFIVSVHSKAIPM